MTVWKYLEARPEPRAAVRRRVGGRGKLLLDVTGVAYSPEFVGSLIIASGLAFVWGTLYHVTRHWRHASLASTPLNTE